MLEKLVLSLLVYLIQGLYKLVGNILQLIRVEIYIFIEVKVINENEVSIVKEVNYVLVHLLHCGIVNLLVILIIEVVFVQRDFLLSSVEKNDDEINEQIF